MHAGNVDGVAICCMFNKIISGKNPPKYLSSDHDPLFKFHTPRAQVAGVLIFVFVTLKKLKLFPIRQQAIPTRRVDRQCAPRVFRSFVFLERTGPNKETQ